MILQKVVFPIGDLVASLGKAETAALFGRGERSGSEEGRICVKAGEKVSFDTYFGSFSMDKWKKYADVGNPTLRVVIEGEFLLTTYCREIGGQESKKLDEITVSGVGEVPVRGEGIFYFEITALRDGKILSAEYRTDAPVLREVNLCTVICTYRREEFVKRNVEILRALSEGELRGRLHTIVVDNGKTLPQDLSGNTVLVCPNKNAGGAGGFTRGLMEMMKLREEKSFSHVLMMDDDVALLPETILRTVSLLSYLKEDYQDAFVSGGMLRLYQPTMQSEGANYWNFERGAVVPRKHNFDLSDFEKVVENEKEEPINYSSWWYCVMPAAVPQEDNLPLPLFIKRDDVEYGLRNGKRFLTLNGIAVWHEPFEKKRPAALEYYYIRNRLVMDFSLGKIRTKKEYERYLLRETILSCLRFRYNEAESLLLGAKDFCRGIDWLKSVDPTEKNDEVRTFNAKPEAIEKGEVEKCRPAKKLSGKAGKILRIVTANGWLLPSKKTVLAPFARPSYKLFFGAKRALNYDEESGMGYYTLKKWSRFFVCIKNYLSVKKEFSARYDALVKEYAERGGELKRLSFWRSYLGLEKE